MPWPRKNNQTGTNKQTQKQQPLCSSGSGYGRLNVASHPIRFAKCYNDSSRGLLGVNLTREESRAAYTCRKCKAWTGCATCIEDLASLICHNCHDWANDISELVHGRIIKDPELQKEGMRLVIILYLGNIDWQEYIKGWNKARAFFGALDPIVMEAPAIVRLDEIVKNEEPDDPFGNKDYTERRNKLVQQGMEYLQIDGSSPEVKNVMDLFK